MNAALWSVRDAAQRTHEWPLSAMSASYGERSMHSRQFHLAGAWRGLFAAAFVCLLPVARFASAQGSDDQYDVTVKMQMAGMSMPPMSQRLCVKKGANDGDFIPRQENCRVSDMVRTGSRLTFKMACAGNNPMTGAGDFTFGGSGYNGQIRMKGRMEGQDVDMTQAIDARRIGGCTARQ